jgi:arylsulfatase A-like enzyme
VVLHTSDHGEELFDHGKVGHGGTLHDEVLRIPLILRLPHGPHGRTVDCPARTLDVLPTLLDAAGLPLPSGVEGRSLLPLLSGPSDDPALELVAETRHKQTYRLAIRSGRHKYIRSWRTAEPDRAGASVASAFRAGMRVRQEPFRRRHHGR